MHYTSMAVAAFAREVQGVTYAARPRLVGKGDSEVQQPIDHALPMLHGMPYYALVAQSRAGIKCVFYMGF